MAKRKKGEGRRGARPAPAPLPRAARRALAEKQLRTSEHWTDVWREEHASAFTAARLTQESLVAEVHRELVKALEAGETMETFRGRVQPWLEGRGWSPPARGGTVPTRLARIYRTNMRTARAAGEWDSVLKNAESRPYLEYRLGPSIEHRKEHAEWEGLILRYDDPWWNTHFPPNGWGCKCRVRNRSRRERDRLLERGERWRTEAPPIETEEWVPPRTRATDRSDDPRIRDRDPVDVPKGIDPGWDYNVGAHRTLGLHRRMLERTEAMADGRALPGLPARERHKKSAEWVQRWLTSPGWRWYVEKPRPELPPKWQRTREVEAAPVAVYKPGDMPPGAVEHTLRLPETIADKQWRRHGLGRRGRRQRRGANETPVDWYRDIQWIIEHIRPVPDSEPGRWQYQDKAYKRPDGKRGRLLVVGLDDAGRPMVYTFFPKSFETK